MSFLPSCNINICSRDIHSSLFSQDRNEIRNHIELELEVELELKRTNIVEAILDKLFYYFDVILILYQQLN